MTIKQAIKRGEKVRASYAKTSKAGKVAREKVKPG